MIRVLGAEGRGGRRSGGATHPAGLQDHHSGREIKVENEINMDALALLDRYRDSEEDFYDAADTAGVHRRPARAAHRGAGSMPLS